MFQKGWQQLDDGHIANQQTQYWLVVSTPLKNMSQLG